MAVENRCIVLKKVDKIVMENRPIPELRPGDVMIHVDYTGICGSDIHYYVKGKIGPFEVKKPMILGHESAGTITAVGKDVVSLKVGDRVAIEPGVPCRMCEQCKQGKYNLCPDMVFAATPPYDGTLCDHYRHPADFCFKLPDHVTLQEGALIEPLSVGLHATRRANVQYGDRVFVFGAGPVGLLCAAAAKAAGAGHVTIADISEHRTNFARSYYTDDQIALKVKEKSESDTDYAARTAKDILTGRALFDVVIDCTGANTCVQMSILLAKNGGSVVLVGMGPSEQTIPIAEVSTREVDVKGVFRYCNVSGLGRHFWYRRAVEILAAGTIDVKPLITNTFDFEKAIDAFEHVRKGDPNTVKVMIHNRKPQ